MKNFFCPKCKKPNAELKQGDTDDEWNDLYLVCPDCGYDEREIKKGLKS